MKFFRRSHKDTVSEPAPRKQAMQFLVPKGVGWTVDDLHQLEAGGKFREALERWQILLAPFQDPQVGPRIALLPEHRYLWIHMGMCYRRLEMYDESLEAYDKAAALARQAGDEGNLAEIANNIGVVHRNRGEVDKALHQFQDARRAAEGVKDMGLLATVHDNIAMCYRMQGLLEKAMAEEDRARATVASNPSRVSAAVQARVLGNLGLLYVDLGRREDAIAVLELALAKAREARDVMQEDAILHNLHAARG
jgi:tetratricopeptide (TPR) repeat protein